jgi:hypothetical protein
MTLKYNITTRNPASINDYSVYIYSLAYRALFVFRSAIIRTLVLGFFLSSW